MLRAGVETVELQAKLFRGLADASRLAILEALRGGPLTVSQIMERTGLSQSNASNHLACLRDCALVSPVQEERYVRYCPGGPSCASSSNGPGAAGPRRRRNPRLHTLLGTPKGCASRRRPPSFAWPASTAPSARATSKRRPRSCQAAQSIPDVGILANSARLRKHDDTDAQHGTTALGATTAQDPTCKRSVDASTARWRSSYQRKTHLFCMQACKETFDEEPAQVMP